MSQNVPDTEQGLLQGTISSVNTMTMIIGPLFATGVFALSTGPNAMFNMPGAYYFFGATLFAITIWIVTLDRKKFRASKP